MEIAEEEREELDKKLEESLNEVYFHYCQLNYIYIYIIIYWVTLADSAQSYYIAGGSWDEERQENREK